MPGAKSLLPNKTKRVPKVARDPLSRSGWCAPARRRWLRRCRRTSTAVWIAASSGGPRAVEQRPPRQQLDRAGRERADGPPRHRHDHRRPLPLRRVLQPHPRRAGDARAAFPEIERDQPEAARGDQQIGGAQRLPRPRRAPTAAGPAAPPPPPRRADPACRRRRPAPSRARRPAPPPATPAAPTCAPTIVARKARSAPRAATRRPAARRAPRSPSGSAPAGRRAAPP